MAASPPITLVAAPDVPPLIITLQPSTDDLVVAITASSTSLSLARDRIRGSFPAETADGCADSDAATGSDTSSETFAVVYALDGLLSNNGCAGLVPTQRHAKVFTHHVALPPRVAHELARLCNEAFMSLSLFGLALLAPSNTPKARVALRPRPKRVNVVQASGGRGSPKQATSHWTRAGQWSPEHWPVLLAGWVARYATAALTTTHSPTAMQATGAAASEQSFSGDIASTLYRLGAEIDADKYGDWSLRIAPMAGHWRRMTQAARTADLMVEGDDAPGVFYISFRKDPAVSALLTSRASAAFKNAFDPTGAVAWGPATALGDQYFIYGEAPPSFAPAAPRISARITAAAADGDTIDAVCERRADGPSASVTAATRASTDASVLRIIQTALPTRTAEAAAPTTAATKAVPQSSAGAAASTLTLATSSSISQSHGPNIQGASPHPASTLSVKTAASAQLRDSHSHGGIVPAVLGRSIAANAAAATSAVDVRSTPQSLPVAISTTSTTRETASSNKRDRDGSTVPTAATSINSVAARTGRAVDVSRSMSATAPRSRSGKQGARGVNTVWAVAVGTKTGLFDSWETASSHCTGIAASVHKAFRTRAEAQTWMALQNVRTLPPPAPSPARKLPSGVASHPTTATSVQHQADAATTAVATDLTPPTTRMSASDTGLDPFPIAPNVGTAATAASPAPPPADAAATAAVNAAPVHASGSCNTLPLMAID